MRLHFGELALFLFLLMLCSCDTTPTPSETPDVPTNAIMRETIDSTEMPSVPRTIVEVGLDCADYIEAQWGTEPGKLGLCPDSSEVWIPGPYPPVPSIQGDLFVVDKVNQRILRYPAGQSTPEVIPIPSSYVLNEVCHSNRGWSNVSVSEDRLFLVFPALQEGRVEDQLAVLSLDGQEVQIIDLGAYYPVHSPYLNSLISDRKGGVYLLLPPVGVVHFDANLRSEFRYIGDDDLLVHEGLIVGWNGNLYTYNAESDDLTNWGTDEQSFMRGVEPLDWTAGIVSVTSIVSPTYSRLLGADAQGRLYFKTYEHGSDIWLVRMSAFWDEVTIARVPEETLSPDNLAPDGSLYSIVYDPLDSSISPRIVKCVFDQD